MRDNHEGLPEIISAYERDKHFFCTIAITLGEERRIYEFGINQESFKAIKQILSQRPFEQFYGSTYRYFFYPCVSREMTNRSITYCDIRIEQENKGENFKFAVTKSLIATFMWFYKVKNFQELVHLREIF